MISPIPCLVDIFWKYFLKTILSSMYFNTFNLIFICSQEKDWDFNKVPTL